METITKSIILDKKLRPANLYQVAELAKVSHMTVARVFAGNCRVSDETKQKVISAAETLDYKPNPHARALNGKSTNDVAILWPLGQAYTPPFMDLVIKFQKHGYRLNLCADYGVAKSTEDWLIDQSRRKVAGVILNVFDIYQLSQLEPYLQQFQAAVVVLGYPIRCSVDSIYWDRAAGVGEMVEDIVKSGKRTPAIIGDLSNTTNRIKVDAYVKRFKEHGIGLSVKNLIQIDQSNADGNEAILANYLSNGKPGFDCIFCTNDRVAAFVENYLLRKGIQIPKDVAVVGFDDSEFAQYLMPPLASISRNESKLMECMETLIMQRLANPDLPVRHEAVKMHYVRRESAGKKDSNELS